MTQFKDVAEWQTRYMGDPRQPGFWNRCERDGRASCEKQYLGIGSASNKDGWQVRPLYTAESVREAFMAGVAYMRSTEDAGLRECKEAADSWVTRQHTKEIEVVPRTEHECRIPLLCERPIPVAEVTAGKLGSRLMWHTEDAQGLTPVGTMLYAGAAPGTVTAADAASYVEKVAQDYANRFGFGVSGALTFDSQVKLDHYRYLGQLASEIRALTPQAAS